MYVSRKLVWIWYGSVLLGVASIGAHVIGGEAVAATWIDNFREGNVRGADFGTEFLEEPVSPLVWCVYVIEATLAQGAFSQLVRPFNRLPLMMTLHLSLRWVDLVSFDGVISILFVYHVANIFILSDARKQENFSSCYWGNNEATWGWEWQEG